MKLKHFLHTITALALFAGFISCSSSDNDPEPEIPPTEPLFDLSTEKIEFKSYKPEAQTITIESDQEWRYDKKNGNWFEITEEDENTLSITTETNRELKEFEGEIIFTYGKDNEQKVVKVVQTPRKETSLFILDNAEYAGIQFIHASRNGRYIVGNIYNAHSILYDRETGSIISFNGPSGTLEDGEPAVTGNATDVSNDGIICGIFRDPNAKMENKETHGRVAGSYINGKWEAFEHHTNFTDPHIVSVANKITPDGKYAVGRYNEGSTARGYAAMWDVATGKVIKEYEGRDEGQGGEALNVSDDGNVVVGWNENEYNNRQATMWIDGKKTTYGNGEIMAVSPNGEWKGGYINSDPIIWDKDGNQFTCEVPEDYTTGWIFINVVGCLTDNGYGVGFHFAPIDRFRAPLLFTPDQVGHKMIDFLKEYYGYDDPYDLPEDFYGTPMDISNDMSFIMGWSDLGSWIIELGDPIKEYELQN